MSFPLRNWLAGTNSLDETNFDVLSSLYRRNMDHVAEQIIAYLDPVSRKTCMQVSPYWSQMVISSGAGAVGTKRIRLGDLASTMEATEDTVAVGLQSGKLLLLSSLTCQPLVHLCAHHGPVTAVSQSESFSSPSFLLATGSNRGVVRLWEKRLKVKYRKDEPDEMELNMIASLQPHRDSVTALQLTSSGLWACSLDGCITFTALKGRRRIASAHPIRIQLKQSDSAGTPSPLLCFRVFPDRPSSRFAVGGAHGLWMGDMRKELMRRTLHNKNENNSVSCDLIPLPLNHAPVVALDTSPAVIVAATARAAFLFSSETGECLRILRLRRKFQLLRPPIVTSVRFGSGMVAVATCDGRISAWREEDGFEECSAQYELPSLPLCLSVAESGVCFAVTESEELIVVDLDAHTDDGMDLNESNSEVILRHCCCGMDLGLRDQTFHIFISCPCFAAIRIVLMKAISALVPGFLSLPTRSKLNVFLYGSEELGSEESMRVQEAVQRFARAVNNNQAM